MEEVLVVLLKCLVENCTMRPVEYLDSNLESLWCHHGLESSDLIRGRSTRQRLIKRS